MIATILPVHKNNNVNLACIFCGAEVPFATV